jgi:hypothetical protein
VFRLLLRKLKSVVLEVDQRPTERSSMLGVADRLEHRGFGLADAQRGDNQPLARQLFHELVEAFSSSSSRLAARTRYPRRTTRECLDPCWPIAARTRARSNPVLPPDQSTPVSAQVRMVFGCVRASFQQTRAGREGGSRPAYRSSTTTDPAPNNPHLSVARRRRLNGALMTTPLDRAAQLDLLARLRSSYPELPEAPTPDLIDHERFAAYIKTPHDVGGEPAAPLEFENKQYEIWEENT